MPIGASNRVDRHEREVTVQPLQHAGQSALGSEVAALRQRIAQLECELLQAQTSQRHATPAKSELRQIIDLALQAVVLVDQQGQICQVNALAERLFGYTADELVGQMVEVLVPECSRPLHSQHRDAYVARPVARPMGAGRDLNGRRRNGSKFPVEISLTPIDTDDGLVVLSVIVDITERVQAGERQRFHLTELAHAARLSAVGEMFAELAHEISQPLGAAANYTRASLRLLRSREQIPVAQLQDLLENATAQAVRATQIVQRIGAYLRRSGPGQANLDLNNVIEHVVALPILDVWSGGVAQPVIPELRLAPRLPGVLADRVQIEQVLLNLLRNALDAVTGLPAADRRIAIESAQCGDRISVAVADNGIGLSAEILTRVFTPFFTTKPNGMGLGLSISKSIIEAHGGTLAVESELRQGTRFVFTLPFSNVEEQT